MPPLLSKAPTQNTMGEANKLLRSSIHAFFQNYTSFISVAALLLLPVSSSFLLSQAILTSSPSTLHFISSRLRSLFQASSFPSSSPLFSLLNLLLSQTLFSSIFTLPFTLTFLLLAKASVAQITRKNPFPPFSSILNLYPPLLTTHVFSSFILLSANSSIFLTLFLVFNIAEFVGVSSDESILIISLIGAIIYSIVLANTVLICNLGLIVSAMENCSGYVPLLKACLLMRKRVATALSLALPTNLAMALIEALFQYRVVRMYHVSKKLNMAIVCEGFLIAYMHSVVMVVEIIASCLFYKKCRLSSGENWEEGFGYRIEMEPEDKEEEV